MKTIPLPIVAGALCAFCAAADAQAPAGEHAAALTAERQQTLVRVVRQDCGSCHGMRLTGGLGPPLTRDAVARLPIDVLVATTLHGRPGTPMPAWRMLLSEDDARWIALRLREGFPEEARERR